ncbi:MAG: hypothetical protein B6D63_03855 [Candidatus Latescibacteria bacterium 4484_7]|nr:MAG: hypothetical protein B6D63_03855 [Candidatus Latescibacteria bacterium 4484_7]
MKKLLTVLIIIIIIVAIIWIVLFVNKGRIVNYALDKSFGVMELQIDKNLPSTISQDELHGLFEDVKTKVINKTADKDKLNELAQTFKKDMKDGKLDSLEVTHLVVLLKEAAK